MCHILIARVSGFGKTRRGDDCGSVFGFQGKIDELEVELVVFGADMLRGHENWDMMDASSRTSIISMLTKASKAFSNSAGISR